MWMGGMYDLRAASQSYMRSAGHLGWAFPAGLGAKAACPQRPVIVFTGDAGFWYHIGEIETAVRWNLNSVTVVNNNGGGNQSKRGFDRAYGGEQTERARELWTYRKVNFAQLGGHRCNRSPRGAAARHCACYFAGADGRPTGHR
jgi:acetolactate synthase-1/2/3 large subunit